MLTPLSAFLVGFSVGLDARQPCDVARMYISNTTHDLLGVTILGKHVLAIRDVAALFTHRDRHLDFGNWSIGFGTLEEGYIGMEEGFVSNGMLTPSPLHPEYCQVYWPLVNDTWIPRPGVYSDDFFYDTAFSKIGGVSYESAMYDANRVWDDENYVAFAEGSDVGWSSAYFENDLEDYDYDGYYSYEEDDDDKGWSKEGEEMTWEEFEWMVERFRDGCKENEACLAMYKMPTEGAFWRARVARKRRQ